MAGEKQLETARWSPDEEFFKIFFGIVGRHADLSVGFRSPNEVFRQPDRLEQFISLNRELWCLFRPHIGKDKRTQMDARLAQLNEQARELGKRIRGELSTGRTRGLDSLVDELYSFLDAEMNSYTELVELAASKGFSVAMKKEYTKDDEERDTRGYARGGAPIKPG